MDKKKEQQRKQEDVAFNRSIAWVVGAIVLEMLLIMANNFYFNYTTTTESINRALATQSALGIVRIAGALLAVAGLVYLFYCFRSGKSACILLVGSVCFCALAAGSAHITLVFQDAGMRMLLVLIPAVGALGLVYFLYQRDLFFAAAVTGFGAVAVWMGGHVSVATTATVYSYLLLVAAGILTLLSMLGRVRKARGLVRISSRTFQMLPVDTNYPVLLGTILANSAAIAIGLTFSAFTFYLICALAAWLFILLVYYTVRMM